MVVEGAGSAAGAGAGEEATGSGEVSAGGMAETELGVGVAANEEEAELGDKGVVGELKLEPGEDAPVKAERGEGGGASILLPGNLRATGRALHRRPCAEATASGAELGAVTVAEAEVAPNGVAAGHGVVTRGQTDEATPVCSGPKSLQRWGRLEPGAFTVGVSMGRSSKFKLTKGDLWGKAAARVSVQGLEAGRGASGGDGQEAAEALVAGRERRWGLVGGTGCAAAGGARRGSELRGHVVRKLKTSVETIV
ncbi:glycine-rich protein 1-like [Setaria italica]|uniref:glycine-rich protein 1-like n=1 Tax=Setaria italica TaxID=4555 RepID=UPI000350C982|nr:glycine-rich protein 1-like [Setaria italica]